MIASRRKLCRAGSCSHNNGLVMSQGKALRTRSSMTWAPNIRGANHEGSTLCLEAPEQLPVPRPLLSHSFVFLFLGCSLSLFVLFILFSFFTFFLSFLPLLLFSLHPSLPQSFILSHPLPSLPSLHPYMCPIYRLSYLPIYIFICLPICLSIYQSIYLIFFYLCGHITHGYVQLINLMSKVRENRKVKGKKKNDDQPLIS